MNNKALFLCCCSNCKLAGGERAYRSANSMPLSVPNQGHKLLAARHRVFQRIENGVVSTRGTPLRELPYNDHPPLVLGPDRGGEANGQYMSAMTRYRGRFYQELDPDEAGVLAESPHRWLIASALYGLVTPEEPIQRYSCHTLDDPGLTEIWTGGNLLTSVLLDYVRVYEVGLIVDLTADASYQGLFDWERVAKRVQVLRAFGAQNAGPALLPALGLLARERLLQIPAEELFGIDQHKTYVTDYEDVVLTRSYQAPPEQFLGEPPPPDEPDDKNPVMPAPPPPPPVRPPDDGSFILPRAREIPVTSRGHGTIFGPQIDHIRDLPPDVRPLFDQMSRAAEVLHIHLGRREQGAATCFRLDLCAPGRGGNGVIDANLKGPGRKGGTQRLRIHVTPGREWATYRALTDLLTQEQGQRSRRDR